MSLDLTVQAVNAKTEVLMALTADEDLYTNPTLVNCHGVEAESSANYPIPPAGPRQTIKRTKCTFSFTHQISLTHTYRQCRDGAECHRRGTSRMP